MFAIRVTEGKETWCDLRPGGRMGEVEISIILGVGCGIYWYQ